MKGYYSINQLATLAGVSVRTLHYYDEIGLLTPDHVKDNGYRYYGEKQLLLLQQILFFKELEMPLSEVKKIMGSTYFDRGMVLKDQKNLLNLKMKRLKKIIHTIDKTLSSMNNNHTINDEELYDAFNDAEMKQYHEEAKQRWGNTDAYKQSMERVSKMTKAQMDKLKADGKAHLKAIADAMPKGISHPDVQALIAKSHEGINFFYDCSLEMFRNLSNMYVEDPRFKATYENVAPGLAQFMRDAIHYYCDQKEGK